MQHTQHLRTKHTAHTTHTRREVLLLCQTTRTKEMRNSSEHQYQLLLRLRLYDCTTVSAV